MIVGQLLLVLAHFVNDWVVLSRFKVAEELTESTEETARVHKDKKSAPQHETSTIGVIGGALYICSGMLIGSAQYGYVALDNADGWGESMGMMCLYFGMGQIALMMFHCLSTIIVGRIRGINVQSQLEAGNHALAIRVACDLIAMTLMISGPIGMSDSVVTFLAYTAMGYACIMLFHLLFRSGFSPWCCTDSTEACEIILKGKYFHDQWGAALVEGVCAMCMSKLLTTFLRSCDCYESWFVTTQEPSAAALNSSTVFLQNATVVG
jgi:uncharacterized membrane protein YjfL (UPF0719 family)